MPHTFKLTFTLLILWLALASSNVAGQSANWARQFGTSWPDSANGVTTDESGNVFVVGQTSGVLPGESRQGGLSDAYVRKYDGEGNQLWTRQFGGQGDDSAQDVAVNDSGDVYIVGNTAGTFPPSTIVGGISGAFVRKCNPDGVELWDRQFGVDSFASASGVDVDRDGAVYVAGNVEGPLPGQLGLGFSDAFLRRYDGDGQMLWTVQFGGAGGDFATDVAVDGNGNVYVVGWNRGKLVAGSNSIFVNAFVQKFDGDGQELWARQFAVGGINRATGVAVDKRGNAYVVGWISGVFPGQAQVGRTDGFVRKYAPDGELIWTRQFGTPDEDRPIGIDLDGSGSPYVVGWTRGLFPDQTGLGTSSALVRNDAFVQKFDADGRQIWTRQFGTQLEQSANGVDLDADGNLYVVGQTASPLFDQSPSGGLDAFLVQMSDDSPTAAIAPAPTTPATSTAIPTVNQVTPTPGQVTPTPPPTPGHSAGGACSFPTRGGDRVDLGWILLGLFLPGLLLVSRARENRPAIWERL